MKTSKIVWLCILGIVLLFAVGSAIDLGTGWFGVYKTKTVGKAQQNADRTVFENTQSRVEGKREELVKLHHEWVKADDDSKKDIEATIRLSFANFDQDLIIDPDLHTFLHKIMNE